MKFKKLFSAVGLTTMSLFATAQTAITNAGFEAWTSSGSTIRPANWNTTTNMNASQAGALQAIIEGAAPQTVWQDAAHSGTYSAKIQTTSALSNTVNGALVTGQVRATGTNVAQGYISATPSTGYAMAFTGLPDSLVFWYKYTAAGSNDQFSVEARLHLGNGYAPDAPVSGNHPDSSAKVIRKAIYHSPTGTSTASWTRMSIPFTNPNGISYAPQYILISTTSSYDQGGNAAQGSTLWLDDFEAIYNPHVTNVATISPTNYTVTNTTGSAITVPFTFTGTYAAGATLTAQLSDASGSFASPVSLGTVTDNFTRTTTGTAPVYSGTIAGTIPSNTATGTYKVRIISSLQTWISDTATIHVNLTNCGNTIIPSAQQNIITNEQGSQLGVSESFTATSHAWFYGTTIGSYPTSLNNTTASYIPQFATAGTYYVVCQSTGGSCDTVTSSPVTIVVSDPVPTITTQDVSPLSYDISAHANTQITVSFTTSNLTSFNAGNQFNVEISDQTGSFTVPSQTYSVQATAIAPITFQLSNTLAAGTQYLVRVSSTNPAITGEANTTPFTVNPFTVSINPNAQQNLAVGAAGTPLNAVESQATTSRQWEWKPSAGTFASLGQTDASYTPQFTTAATRYIRVCSVNQLASDTVCSDEVTIVTGTSGINDISKTNIKIYQAGNDLIIDADNSLEQNNNFALYNIVGQELLRTAVKQGKTTLSVANLAAGVYTFRLGEYSGKVVLK